MGAVYKPLCIMASDICYEQALETRHFEATVQILLFTDYLLENIIKILAF